MAHERVFEAPGYANPLWPTMVQQSINVSLIHQVAVTDDSNHTVYIQFAGGENFMKNFASEAAALTEAEVWTARIEAAK